MLAPNRFTHPLDMEATAALKRIPFAETLVRDGIGGVVEQAVFLDNLSNSVRVGPKQLPEIWNGLVEAKAILGLTIPIDVYIRQNPVPNAYTMAMQGKRPFIVLHSSLIELLSPDEVCASASLFDPSRPGTLPQKPSLHPHPATPSKQAIAPTCPPGGRAVSEPPPRCQQPCPLGRVL